MVNVGSIPTGSTHGEGRLQSHPGDVLTSTANVRKSPRSGLNLEGRLSDPQIITCCKQISNVSRAELLQIILTIENSQSAQFSAYLRGSRYSQLQGNEEKGLVS